MGFKEADKINHFDEEEEDKDKNNPNKNSGLSREQRDRINKQGASIHEIAREIEESKKLAELKLNKKVRELDPESQEFFSPLEHQQLLEKIEKAESKEEIEEVEDKIDSLENTIALKKQKAIDENKELDPQNPELLKLEEQFKKICDKNRHLIGEKQLPGFKKWIEEQREKKPTIKNLKELIKKLEGEETHDSGGLYPRQQEFDALKKLFQKNGISNPLESDWIKNEGLSERREFRKNAEALQEHFERQKDTNLYSEKVVDASMQAMLKAKNPLEQKELNEEATKIGRLEAEKSIQLDAKMQVGGVTIRKMSEKSKSIYLREYYKNQSIKDRENDINNWGKLVEHEADLAEKLEKIYQNDPENFKMALSSFADLDFMAKEQALKDHEKLVQNSREKNDLRQALIIRAAHNAIDKGKAKQTISDKTAERFKKAFEDQNNYLDQKTGKPDLTILDSLYKTLTSTDQNTRFDKLGGHNLAAYEAKRKDFSTELKTLENITSEIDEEELKKWQNRYDKEGWKGRQKIAVELKGEIAKQKEKNAEKLEQEEKAGITKNDKKEAKEGETNKQETMKAALQYLSEDKPREALKTLMLYDQENPDDREILTMIELSAMKLKQLGTQKEVPKEQLQKIQQEMEQVVEEEDVHDLIHEHQALEIQIEGVEQSERRHGAQVSAEKRAAIEALDKTDSGSLEEELVKDYIEMSDGEHILDANLTGKEVDEYKFDQIKTSDRERRHLQRRARKDKANVVTNKGVRDMEFTDEGGHTIRAREAKKKLNDEQNELMEDMADRTVERLETKQKVDTNAQNVSDFATKAEALRQARKQIEEHNEEIPETA